MNKEEYDMVLDGTVCADRMALGLPAITDRLRGDMEEVSKLKGDLAAMSNSYHAANKERLNMKDKLFEERTVSDCLAGAISGTFDYSEAITRYNASLEHPRSGIPQVNIFTRRDGAP